MSDAPESAASAPDASAGAPARGWLADPDRERDHERWLLELTGIPTAAGHEDRVIAWIEAWAAERSLEMTADRFGNRMIARPGANDERPMIYQAHVDHPAFVVEDRAEDRSLDLTFRGGVRDPYFVDGRIVILGEGDVRIPATITASENVQPLRRCRAVLDDPGAEVSPGSIGVWDLPAPGVDADGILHAPAVDDLAGVAAALSALDACLRRDLDRDVRVFLTRGEEVGFLGTIAACREGTVPKGADLVTLETSRSFADSPVGGGPIVRVGDRLSTFDPGLTALAGEVGADVSKEHEDFRWQRKLMVGGACEATMYVRSGYVTTCLCLPLGNYHNMAELDRVERTTPDRATIAPEFIAVDDFHGLVRLLVGMAERPAGEDAVLQRLDQRFERLGWILDG